VDAIGEYGFLRESNTFHEKMVFLIFAGAGMTDKDIFSMDSLLYIIPYSSPFLKRTLHRKIPATPRKIATPSRRKRNNERRADPIRVSVKLPSTRTNTARDDAIIPVPPADPAGARAEAPDRPV
jgi:hypothetical protein